MTSNEIREKFIKFFEKRGHVRIESSPLVLENDPTTLFTSAGMQQLTPYLKGKAHPKGKRLVDSQLLIRLQDIEEVGDNRHTTFFEMLGNWSLGDYFKKEQLLWFFEFLTSKENLRLELSRLYVSVFEGSREVPKDEESVAIWQELFKTREPAKIGIDGFNPKTKIYMYPAEKNWWSISGTPEEMPAGEIGGPDSEVFYDFDPENKLHFHENSKYKNVPCHINCDCGRFLEFGNSVFIQYIKQKDGTLTELPQKNVDFGGGLERICAVASGEQDIFKIDVFMPTILNLQEFVGVKYGESEKTDTNFRIIADHLRAASYLIAEGVVPSNKLQGYVVRRLIRRSVFRLKLLGFDLGDGAISTFARTYVNDFEIIKNNWHLVKDELNIEALKFNSALERGLSKLNRMYDKGKITGKLAFELYQTDGFPLELTLEILEEKGQKFSDKDKKEFYTEFEKHKELSRTASAGMFKGGLSDKSEDVTKLHTATHLLHAALRKILGEHVSQKGSNITAERLRFDFSHPQKLTEEEVKKVEDLINEQIKKDLPVSFETMTLKKAIAKGALHFFAERYGDKVKVYTIGSPSTTLRIVDPSTRSGSPFSKEICGGPHVSSTGVIGRVKIFKQEKVGSGIIRIYATTNSSKL